MTMSECLNSVSEVEVMQDETLALVLRMRGALQGPVLSEVEAILRGHCLRALRPVFLDLSELLGVDENGIRVLIRLARALHTKRSKLHIIAPNPAVERCLRLANLHTLIPMYANVPQALECLEIA